METQIFQMVGSTRSTLNGFGDSSCRDQPPPPPDPTIVATQTEMKRQILLYLQQQSQQQQPHGNRIDAQGQLTEYKHFLDMNPLQFNGTEEPLDVDAWIRAIEAMFAVFTLPCSEGRKAKFAALQLRGSALKCGGNTTNPCNNLSMKSLGKNSKRLSEAITFRKHLPIGKRGSYWLSRKGQTQCTNMRRSLITSSSMEDIMWIQT
jgi:hypothetical protein